MPIFIHVQMTQCNGESNGNSCALDKTKELEKSFDLLYILDHSLDISI